MPSTLASSLYALDLPARLALPTRYAESGPPSPRRNPSRMGSPNPHVDDLLAALDHESQRHPALSHIWLRTMAANQYADMSRALRNFAREYSIYSESFCAYLSRAIDKLSSPSHRRLLAVNLEEEMGSIDPEDRARLRRAGIDPDQVEGIPHARLYQRFCEALGLGSEELARGAPFAEQWRDELLVFLDDASPAAAVGALGPGTENVVSRIYRPLCGAIRRSGLVREEDAVFFLLHCEVDDQHALDLRNVARDLLKSEDDYRQMRMGMREALRLRQVFFSQLHRHAVGSPNEDYG